MSTFELLPAIDLRAGRVVRLRQGDFARETAYGDDPVEVGRAFAAAGAPWLHVVDLDGAREGRPRHLETARAIGEAARATTRGATRCELAGGLRSAAAVEEALTAGLDRVVLGTAALRDPSLVRRLVERYGPARLAVAIDVRGGRALGDAWREGRPGPRAEDAIRTLADLGIVTFEVTAIERDGQLTGPDLDLLGRLVELGRGAIVASGGIASLDDLRAIRALGCSGAIVGRALYEGRLDLRAALAALA